MKITLGYDSHKLEEFKSAAITLGGVRIQSDYRTIAHSDGDVICHSLIDCIAPAFLNKSIGELYSNKDTQNTGAYSLDRLCEVYKKAGMPKIINIDIIVISDEIMMCDVADKIKENLSKALNIKSCQIYVKGKTTEGENPNQRFIKALSCILFE